MTEQEVKKEIERMLMQKEFTYTLRDRENEKVTGTRHAIKISDAKIILNKTINLALQKSREDILKKIDEILTPQFFHETYEKEADKQGWETQNACKVSFDDLPETNQLTMIYTIEKIRQEIKKEIEK